MYAINIHFDFYVFFGYIFQHSLRKISDCDAWWDVCLCMLLMMETDYSNNKLMSTLVARNIIHESFLAAYHYFSIGTMWKGEHCTRHGLAINENIKNDINKAVKKQETRVYFLRNRKTNWCERTIYSSLSVSLLERSTFYYLNFWMLRKKIGTVYICMRSVGLWICFFTTTKKRSQKFMCCGVGCWTLQR